MNQNVSVQSQERRRFFRIDDEIVLFYRSVDGSETPDLEEIKRQMADPFSLGASLELLSQDAQSLLHRIHREQPDVADFLQILEKKIDIIAQAVMRTHSDLADQPTHKVSLSASGIAFDAEENLANGQALELKLVIPPSLVGIVTYGRVVYSQKNADQGYRIGVDFLTMQEQDREYLIRHVVKRQLAELRSKTKRAE